MTKKTCEICGKEVDTRGFSGHMRTHGNDEHQNGDKPVNKPVKGQQEDLGVDESGVISYPSNDKKKNDGVVSVDKRKSKDKIPETKQVKKTVASKPASNPASKPDPRGQRKSEKEHKKEWSLFR